MAGALSRVTYLGRRLAEAPLPQGICIAMPEHFSASVETVFRFAGAGQES